MRVVDVCRHTELFILISILSQRPWQQEYLGTAVIVVFDQNVQNKTRI